jgi:hypothetical protein
VWRRRAGGRNAEWKVCGRSSALLHKGPDTFPGLYTRVAIQVKTNWYSRVGLPGLEPGTSSLSEKRSNRLSYRPEAEVAAGLIYNTDGTLTSRLKTGEAGSTIGTVSESHYASRCERSI